MAMTAGDNTGALNGGSGGGVCVAVKVRTVLERRVEHGEMGGSFSFRYARLCFVAWGGGIADIFWLGQWFGYRCCAKSRSRCVFSTSFGIGHNSSPPPMCTAAPSVPSSLLLFPVSARLQPVERRTRVGDSPMACTWPGTWLAAQAGVQRYDRVRRGEMVLM